MTLENSQKGNENSTFPQSKYHLASYNYDNAVLCAGSKQPDYCRMHFIPAANRTFSRSDWSIFPMSYKVKFEE